MTTQKEIDALFEPFIGNHQWHALLTDTTVDAFWNIQLTNGTLSYYQLSFTIEIDDTHNYRVEFNDFIELRAIQGEGFGPTFVKGDILPDNYPEIKYPIYYQKNGTEADHIRRTDAAMFYDMYEIRIIGMEKTWQILSEELPKIIKL